MSCASPPSGHVGLPSGGAGGDDGGGGHGGRGDGDGGGRGDLSGVSGMGGLKRRAPSVNEGRKKSRLELMSIA